MVETVEWRIIADDYSCKHPVYTGLVNTLKSTAHTQSTTHVHALEDALSVGHSVPAVHHANFCKIYFGFYATSHSAGDTAAVYTWAHAFLRLVAVHFANVGTVSANEHSSSRK